MKKIAILLFLSILAFSATARKIMFDSKPYIRELTKEAETTFSALNKQPFDTGIRGFFLKKGKHKIVIRGREAGTLLNALWIGMEHETPPQTRTGIYLRASDADMAEPMKLVDFNGMACISTTEFQKGTAEFSFEIQKEGIYFIWSNSSGLDGSSNSFFLKIDDYPEFGWDTTMLHRFYWRPVTAHIEITVSKLLPIVWAATSPDSPHRENPRYYDMAVRVLEMALWSMKYNQTYSGGLWSMPILESLHMVCNDPRTSPEKVNAMLDFIRPFLEKAYERVEKNNKWEKYTPNIRIQCAAVLTLGAEIWKEKDPETAKKWVGAIDPLLKDALTFDQPGKPLGYGFGAGFDAAYFYYDVMFLSRIYMLTRHHLVGEILKGYGSAAENVTANGQIISLSSPWWKHSYGTTLGVRLVLELSRNPHYAGLMARQDQKGAGHSMIAYYNTLTPAVTMEPADSCGDAAYYAENEKGPFLRSGNMNVIMPWRAWCESSCGAFYSTSTKVVSQVMSVIIAAIETEPGVRGAHYTGAYTIPEALHSIPDYRACIIGESFIASAVSFRPVNGGPATSLEVAQRPNNSPWLRTDIWLADHNGAAGRLEIKALKDNPCVKVAVWPYTSSNFKLEDNKISLDGIQVVLDQSAAGNIRHLGRTWAKNYKQELFEYILKNPKSDGFKAGEAFSTHAAIVLKSGAGIEVTGSSVDNGLYEVEITSGPQKYLLYLNLSDQTLHKEAKGEILQSTSIQAKKLQAGRIDLPPKSLTIIK